MARVECATQAWGVVQTRQGNVVASEPFTTTATVYDAAVGGSPITGGSLVTNADGEIPGFVDVGSWSLTVNGETKTIEAISGMDFGEVPATAGHNDSIDLLVEKVVIGDPATGTTGMRIRHRGPTDSLWATDAAAGLWKSTDDDTTWTRTVDLAATYAQVEQVLELASGFVLIVARAATTNRFIVRSTTTAATAFNTGSPALAFPTSPTRNYLLGPQGWFQDTGGNIYAAEYNDNASAADINVYKSTDDGVSFTVASTVTGSRHFHSIQDDPHVAGRIWVTVGDTGTPGPRIGYSDDAAATWTWIVQTTYPKARAVSLMFDSEAVYWGTDSPDVAAEVWRYDRTTAAVTQVASGLNGPFYYGLSHNGLMVTFSAVELPANGYIGDQYVRALGSGDGLVWRVLAKWRRRQDDATRSAILSGVTEPDSDGTFWASLTNVEGDFNRVSNVKFRMVAAHQSDQVTAKAEPVLQASSAPFLVQHSNSDNLAASETFSFFKAPVDVEIIAVSWSARGALVSSATDYWTLSLRRYRAGAFVNVIAQGGGASVALTALDALDASTFNTGNAFIKAGDVLVARYDKTGAPGNLTKPVCMVWARAVPRVP